MSQLKNPFPDIAEATSAAGKILSLNADLFLVHQELKAVYQIKRVIGLVVGLICFNFLILSTVYWLGMGLHERGWSFFSLATLSFLIFGGLTAISASVALQNNKTQRENKR